ncbi:MAG TPA: aminotransferase [Erysipelotrichaceae bacterium]|nr:aminotransferase [Erysipelotrichaceae bacterium]
MEKDILVTRSSMPSFDEYCDEIKDLWQSRWLTNNGAKHQQLTEQLKQYLGVKNLNLVVNGHAALELSLQVLGLKGEVITTPFTFISTTHAIVRNGLKPVFCDVKPDDFTMDPAKIEDLITDRTCAIMPVHVYGNVCDVDAIQKIADKHHLKVIYDAAHAFGETYKGTGVMNFGDVSCMSFHATKVFHTIEGGAVVSKNPEITEKIQIAKDFGIVGPEEVTMVSENAKMNEFCAAMGICNLRHVDEEIAKRGKAVARYRERLGDVDGLQLNPIQKDVKPNYAYFPVIFDEKLFGATRNEVMENLAAHDIGARKYFYPLTNTFECFHNMFDVNETPVALHMSRHVLTLPLYADLSVEDVDRICDIVLSLKK